MKVKSAALTNTRLMPGSFSLNHHKLLSQAYLKRKSNSVATPKRTNKTRDNKGTKLAGVSSSANSRNNSNNNSDDDNK